MLVCMTRIAAAEGRSRQEQEGSARETAGASPRLRKARLAAAVACETAHAAALAALASLCHGIGATSQVRPAPM